ncbi:MAG: hypothetical protein H0X66_01660 [Verrucomicrobia bacterium]|nr:hypothetical protein [Verrucomicrobiota bacterium]
MIVDVHSHAWDPGLRPAYRDVYYNNHETGGGLIQDALTHLVNAVEWIVGPTGKGFCAARHQALEGVEVEDTACVTAQNGDTLVSYSLNQFQLPNETAIQILKSNRATLQSVRSGKQVFIM